MEALKRILNILSGLFILLALLVILNVLDRGFFITTFGLLNLESTFKALLIVALVLLALQLLVYSLYSMALKTDIRRSNLKINELKADLYDKRQLTKQRERDAQMADTGLEPGSTEIQARPLPKTHSSPENTAGDVPYNPHI